LYSRRPGCWGSKEQLLPCKRIWAVSRGLIHDAERNDGKINIRDQLINWLFSWRAESRSCPNGFSIMTLRQRPFSSRNKPNSANRFAIVAK
jgi:hypothetical protein